MPQLIPIALTDDNATTFTFNPTSSNGTTAILMTDDEVSRDLEKSLKIVRSENKTRQRVNIKVRLPETQLDTAGNTVVFDESMVSCDFMFPHSASDTNRAIIVQLMKAALDNAVIKAVAEDGSGLW